MLNTAVSRTGGCRLASSYEGGSIRRSSSQTGSWRQRGDAGHLHCDEPDGVYSSRTCNDLLFICSLTFFTASLKMSCTMLFFYFTFHLVPLVYIIIIYICTLVLLSCVVVIYNFYFSKKNAIIDSYLLIVSIFLLLLKSLIKLWHNNLKNK